MVPSITDTECRIAEMRYRELHAEADRQRRSAHSVTQAERVGKMMTVARHLGTLMIQAGQVMRGMPSTEVIDSGMAPRPVAVNQ